MLEETDRTIRKERSTTKSPLTDADVETVLGSVDRVLIARGKSLRELAPSEAELDDLKGPSGKYRAPMLVTGKTLLVGFSEKALAEL
ncbi:MAG: hypothetical protein MJB57_06000 [Gemmatimonadetes bacterium]|nr:hypothetical protein [Gemmatimonadota bacterium]